MMKKPTGIAPILKSMTQGLGLEKEMKHHRLKMEWAKIVGETIAAHTLPEKIKFTTLTLCVDSPTWMHELSFLKTELIQKINAKLGKAQVRTIHLKIGKVSKESTQHKQSHQKKKSLSPEELTILEQQLASVSDEHLKAVIHKAMKKHLQAKKGIKS